MTQWLDLPPAGLRLTGSLWLKETGGNEIQLTLTDGAGEEYGTAVTPGAAWQRFAVAAAFSIGNASQRVGFRLALPALASAQVFGAQLMSMAGPGAYVRTTNASGLHPRCRLADDTFAQCISGYGHSDIRLSIIEFV